MGLSALVVAISALVIAIVGIPMFYEWFKDWAAASLLKDIRVKPLPEPVSDGDRTFWLIQLRIGKGNWACRLLRQRAKTVMAIKTTFQGIGENSNVFNSYAYQFDLDIRDRHIQFTISPRITKNLAVVQRPFGNPVQTMGDSFGFSYLRGSYDLLLSFKHNARDLKTTKLISHYIEDGNPKVTAENVRFTQ